VFSTEKSYKNYKSLFEQLSRGPEEREDFAQTKVDCMPRECIPTVTLQAGEGETQ